MTSSPPAGKTAAVKQSFSVRRRRSHDSARAAVPAAQDFVKSKQQRDDLLGADAAEAPKPEPPKRPPERPKAPPPPPEPALSPPRRDEAWDDDAPGDTFIDEDGFEVPRESSTSWGMTVTRALMQCGPFIMISPIHVDA